MQHANLVEICELTSADDEVFVVMEYLEGETAAALIERVHSHNHTLDYGIAAYVVAEAAAAMDAAHGFDVLHAHLSPHDIFIGYDGTVKVLDVGITCALEQMIEATMIDERELPYASPERCTDGTLDRRSDVFSLGTILWELMTGISPFERMNEADTIHAILHEKPAVPPNSTLRAVPMQLSEIAIRAVARDPDKRYPTARALRHELRTFLRGLRIDEAPVVSLGKVMHSLFEQRIKSNTEMLRCFASSSENDSTEEPRRNPVAPILRSSIAPDVAAPDTDTDHTPRASPVPKKPGRQRLAFVSVATLLALCAMAFVVSARSERPSKIAFTLSDTAEGDPSLPNGPGSIPSPPSTTSTSDVPSASIGGEQQVTLSIDTVPANSTIVIGGTVMGVSPIELKLPKNEDPMILEIRHTGYQTLKEQIVPDLDQRLRLMLVGTTRTAPSASSAPYRRFE